MLRQFLSRSATLMAVALTLGMQTASPASVIPQRSVYSGECHGIVATDATHSVYIDMTVLRHIYSDGHTDVSGSALLNGTTANGQTVAVSIWAKDLKCSWVTMQGQQYRHVQVTTNPFVLYNRQTRQRVRAYAVVDVTAIPGAAGQMGFQVIRASDGARLAFTTDANGNYAELPLKPGGWTANKF
ncbi:MAG TPA: hypothetical protein VFB38_24885 [Chthonomonadaceae bacterium]|nr:hypothetical protein [Chthonomonadaceae bacterium]